MTHHASIVCLDLAFRLSIIEASAEEREFVRGILDDMTDARNEEEVQFVFTIAMRHRDIFPRMVEMIEDVRVTHETA